LRLRVVGVIDGDTISALTTDNQLLRVRLKNIDAPEKGQAFAQAKQNFSRLVCSDRRKRRLSTVGNRAKVTLERRSGWPMETCHFDRAHVRQCPAVPCGRVYRANARLETDDQTETGGDPDAL
jgi:hypothetical protein